MTVEAVIGDTHAAAKPVSKTWVAFATMIGTTIEWYDFFIFGTASALIFNKLFFPSFDPLVGTIAALSTFAVGLFARPIGAILFGHFGDRIGRKKMLVASLLLMGVPTTLIGILPTYEQIGIFAAVLLVLIRVCQGIALGGEWGGAVLMAVEHAPKRWGAFFGSMPQAGCPMALILSSLAFSLIAQLPPEQFEAWGWRLPFIASAVLVVVGIFIRRRVAESPAFRNLEQSGRTVEVPALEVAKNHLTPVLLGVGAKLGEITMFWLVAVFVLSYTTGKLGLARADVLHATLMGAVLQLILMPVCGLLSVRFGKREVFVFGNILLVLAAIPLFLLIDTGQIGYVSLAIVVAMGLLYPIMYAPEASLFSALFPAEVRYTGLSLAANVGGAIAGGIAPLAATALLASYGNVLPVGIYLGVIALVSLLCALAMRPVYGD